MSSTISRYKLFIIIILVLSIGIQFPVQKSYETGQVSLDVQVNKPKIGFFSVGDNFTTIITVKNNSNETRYFQITALFRPDVISDSYHGDSNGTYPIIKPYSTVSFHQKFIARSSGLYWLIVGANGFENSTYIGYLISNQSFTNYYIHPSSDVDLMTLAQSTTEGGYLSFISTIIGGGISGTVGFFVVWYTNRHQDKERLKDNVYRRLYGYVIDLYRQRYPTDFTISSETWYKIEPYELLKMDQKIRMEFDTLAEEIQGWNKSCITLGNNYQKNETTIKEVLQTAFGQSNMLNANGNITINDSNYSIDGFIKIFLTAIVNPQIKDSDMLSKVMSDLAEQHYTNRVNDITFLKQQQPLFFNVLFEQLSFLRQVCLVDINYDQMIGYRDTIRNHVIKLKERLEKLVK